MVLLYCASSQQAQGAIAGVAGMSLRTFEAGGVRFFHSEHESLQLGDAAALKQHALEFHHALQAILSTGDIVPFRFPTAFGALDAAQTSLAPRAAEYAAALEAIGGCVQLEATLSIESRRPHGVVSGKEFLEMKAAAARQYAGVIERMMGIDGVAKADVKQQAKGARLYLLVRRDKADSVRAQIAAMPELAGQRITGPWPAGHFIQLEAVVAP